MKVLVSKGEDQQAAVSLFPEKKQKNTSRFPGASLRKRYLALHEPRIPTTMNLMLLLKEPLFYQGCWTTIPGQQLVQWSKRRLGMRIEHVGDKQTRHPAISRIVVEVALLLCLRSMRSSKPSYPEVRQNELDGTDSTEKRPQHCVPGGFLAN